MSSRLLKVAAVTLTVAVAVSLWCNVRSRSRLREAERFVKSGLASWQQVCTEVAELASRGAASQNLAGSCMTIQEYDAVVTSTLGTGRFEEVAAKVIFNALDAHRMPRLLDDREMTQYELPAGYSR